MIIFFTIKKIWHYLSSKRKKQLVFLLFLMIATSVAEVISLGAIIPFLGALSNSEVIFKHELIQPFTQLLGISNHRGLLLPFTVIFIVASVFSGLIRITLLWVQTRVAHAIGADLGYEIYQFILQQSYEEHMSRNSSEVISAISTKVNQVVAQTIRPVLILMSSFFMLVAMSIFLIYVKPTVFLTVLIGFTAIYVIFIFLTRSRLLKNSKIINTKTNIIIKLLQEGLGGIRNVILDDLQYLYKKTFHREDIMLRRAIANNQILSQSPRYGVESLGMVLIALIAYSMGSNEGDFSTAIPVLGAFAVGAQRMLPLLQQSYTSWSAIYGSQATLQDVMNFVEKPFNKNRKVNNTKSLTFEKVIKLTDLSFTYKKSDTQVLNAINIEIAKGLRVGFIGETGSGKSTLLDIIMSLLYPVEGSVSVDGVEVNLHNHHEWQRHIAHIPQSIFLIDDTITRNIAFGIPDKEIDHSRVAFVAKQAGISDTIELLDFKYETIVGERGTRLSGGQRQRIGIARALYRKSDVIILDEATSALDEKTENSVMDEIYKIDKKITIIMVSHRISTMKDCDLIFELDQGKIKWCGKYSDLENKNS
jgi:ATP-binding cassette, subfamily B, bacterial PglK